MDFVKESAIGVEHIIEFVYHHLGLALITFAFILLAVKSTKSKSPVVPRDFAALYGIGGLILAYHMYTEARPIIVFMEVLGAIISLYLAFW